MYQINNLGVDKNIVMMYYNTCVKSMLIYAINVWYSMLSKKSRNQIEKPRRKANMIAQFRGASEIKSFDEKLMVSFVDKVLLDDTHPLHTMLSVSRSGKLLHLYCRTNRFSRSTVPTSIRIYNGKSFC